jgi:hypothetical protein
MKLTTHLHLLPRLRISGSISLLPLYPYMSSQRGQGQWWRGHRRSLKRCFFFVRGAPQQMLRTHRSLKAYCATPVMKISSFFYQVLQVMEHQWNEIDREKPDNSEKNLSQCHFVHHKPHMDLTWDRTRDSVVRGRRLTDWAMARPKRWFTCHSTTWRGC